MQALCICGVHRVLGKSIKIDICENPHHVLCSCIINSSTVWNLLESVWWHFSVPDNSSVLHYYAAEHQVWFHIAYFFFLFINFLNTNVNNSILALVLLHFRTVIKFMIYLVITVRLHTADCWLGLHWGLLLPVGVSCCWWNTLREFLKICQNIQLRLGVNWLIYWSS